MRDRIISETTKVTKIVKEKQMNLKGKTVDLSDWLDRIDKISIEYRKSDIDKIEIPESKKRESMCNFVVRPYDSPDAVREGIGGTAILNFASSKNPGGGFVKGANAQEESLCYRSNLYNVLSKHMSFYEYNRNNLNNSLYTDGIIYSSDVCFFRNSKNGNCEPYYLNVITSAAPNCKAALRNGVKHTEINDTMRRRVEQILKVAIQHDVNHLVLGAFGCGVFGNNPDDVAHIIYDLTVNHEYGRYFQQITFAMHDSTSVNTKAFCKVFQ